MGVLSKALRISSFAIVVGSFAALNGCSGINSNTDNINSTTDAVDASSDAVASGQSSQGEGQSNLANTGMDGMTASDSSAMVMSPVERLSSEADTGVGLTMQRSSEMSRFVAETSQGEPIYDVEFVENPARLVVDLLGLQGQQNKEIALNDDKFLKSIRMGAHKDRTRIVFDLKDGVSAGMMEHKVDTEDGKLVVTFNDMVDGKATVEATSSAAKLDSSGEGAAAGGDSEVVTSTMTKLSADTSSKSKIGSVTVDSILFEKSAENSGRVTVNLSEQTAYDFNKTAPTEYVLTLASAVASKQTTYPIITPKAFPGIRSVRAVQQDGSVAVRMFVDSNMDLKAEPNNNTIVIKAVSSGYAKNPDARAQLEVGDTPKDAAQAASKPAGDKDSGVVQPAGGKVESSDSSQTFTGRLISLDLQDTDIDNALRIIAEVSNLNIIASDDVAGKVTLRLIDVPWDQALDVILKTNGLGMVKEGNVIRIAPIEKLRQEREALNEAKKAQLQLEDLTVNYQRISYARATDLKEQIEAVLSERGTVATDERTNQLIIKDIRNGQTQAAELIKKLDLRTPQVLLETQIIEGTRNIMRDLGFQSNFSYIRSPATGNATGWNFPNSITVGGSGADAEQNAINFPAVLGGSSGSAISAILDSADGSRSLSFRLSALEEDGKVRVVSRPQVATVNNKQAEIKSVEVLRVRLPGAGTSIATGSGATSSGSSASAFEEINVGIQLRVTPQASPDYYVLMDVEAKSSTLGSNSVDDIPSTIDRVATSTILVKSGQTFALGGVYRLNDSDRIQGVPWLKDIPFLGHFFRRTLIDKSDDELIFFITPHIVEGSFDPSFMNEQEEADATVTTTSAKG